MVVEKHRSFIALMFAGLMIAAGSVPAQTRPGAPAVDDEERLVRKVVEEVLRELRQGALLEEMIGRGIRDFVAEQRRAQAGRAARRRSAAELAKSVRRVSSDRDHVFGNPNATISLIEYSDFECPFCKRFHPTATQVVADYGGQVNWVYRHFPLAIHNPGAQLQAEASECANELGGNDAFWEYTNTIFERTRSGGRGFPRRKLTPLAEEIGLDGDAFDECLESRRYRARVQEDFDEGVRIGVTGTPGNILLNNETGEVAALPGAVPIATLKTAIDRLLK